MFKMLIPPDKVERTRKFFRERKGCVLWKSQAIGSSRPDIMTPATHEDGSHATRPHWAYGDPMFLRPEEIGVNRVTRITLPPEWFSKCLRCNGTGRRPIQEIADARECSVEEAKYLLRTETTIDRGVRDEDNTLDCFVCDGTGHWDRHYRVRLRRNDWGHELFNAGTSKAEKVSKKLQRYLLCKELNIIESTPDFILKDLVEEKQIEPKEVQWTWEGIGYGLAYLVFFTEEITPFTLE